MGQHTFPPLSACKVNFHDLTGNCEAPSRRENPSLLPLLIYDRYSANWNRRSQFPARGPHTTCIKYPRPGWLGFSFYPLPAFETYAPPLNSNCWSKRIISLSRFPPATNEVDNTGKRSADTESDRIRAKLCGIKEGGREGGRRNILDQISRKFLFFLPPFFFFKKLKIRRNSKMSNKLQYKNLFF